MERAPKRPEGNPSPAVVWNRLRELQALCGKDVGLLFIGGVDGKFNIGSTRAINFVLSGLSGREICQQINDELEDVSFMFSLPLFAALQFLSDCVDYQRKRVISACWEQRTVLEIDGKFFHTSFARSSFATRALPTSLMVSLAANFRAHW